MTDKEIADKTAEIICRAYKDTDSIDFNGFGSQCDWIGYQLFKLYRRAGRLGALDEGKQIAFNMKGVVDFDEVCVKQGISRAGKLGSYKDIDHKEMYGVEVDG